MLKPLQHRWLQHSEMSKPCKSSDLWKDTKQRGPSEESEWSKETSLSETDALHVVPEDTSSGFTKTLHSDSEILIWNQERIFKVESQGCELDYVTRNEKHMEHCIIEIMNWITYSRNSSRTLRRNMKLWRRRWTDMIDPGL